MDITKLDAKVPTDEQLKERSSDTLIRFIRLLQCQIAAEQEARIPVPYDGDCSLLKRQAD